MIYEICNEPNGDCSWEDIKEYANIVIPVIRRHNQNALILVGTPNFDREIQFAAADPLDFPNIMYTYHFYAASHKEDFREKLIEVVGGGTPIFISECGFCEESGNGKIDFESSKIWFDLLDSLHLSYTIWNLSNKAESAAIIKEDSRATKYLINEDLTSYGYFARALFHGENPDSIQLKFNLLYELKVLWRTRPYMVWLHFALPIFVILLLIFTLHKVGKHFKHKKISSYDDLLKYKQVTEGKQSASKN